MESRRRKQKAAETVELAASLTALGQFVVSEQSLQESLQRVAELSARSVYGADGAGVTWVVAGAPTTVTAAGDFVRRIDEIQYTLDEGPCLDAYRTQQSVLIENFGFRFGDDLAIDRLDSFYEEWTVLRAPVRNGRISVRKLENRREHVALADRDG